MAINPVQNVGLRVKALPLDENARPLPGLIAAIVSGGDVVGYLPLKATDNGDGTASLKVDTELTAEGVALHESVANANLALGANTLSSTPTPAGKIRRITHVTYSYTGTVTGVRLEILAGAVTVRKTDTNPTSGRVEELLGVDLLLNAGEKLDLTITGATATDDATLTIHGSEKTI